MDRDQFLNLIAERHGRELLTQAPTRDSITLPSLETDASESLTEKFTLELEAVGGHIISVSSVSEASDALRKILTDLDASKIVTWERQLFSQWNLNWLWETLGAESIDVTNENTREKCLAADVGITLADFAIAETGTLVLLASLNSPRSVSLTPTTHIALLNKSNLVATSEDAFSAISSRQNTPSSINLITGPSRSADIENDLSIGVHGPAALYVILLDGEFY